MNRDFKTKSGRLQRWLGPAALASVPLALWATTLTDDDLDVSIDAEFGSGANFNSTSYVASIGYANTIVYHATLAVGSYLEAPDAYDTMVVGTWNEKVDAVFTVGIGTGEQDKRNALEVYSGDIVIVNEVQGDIGFGQFGN